MPRRLTTEEFIEKAKLKHGERYSYNKVEYEKWNVKIEIVCSKHGSFFKTPNDHLTGGGCKICGIEKTSNSRRLNKDIFIERAINIHGKKYDYSKVKYTAALSKVIIICPDHGEFKQPPAAHWGGKGCQECSSIKNGKIRRKYTVDSFIIKANQIHNNKYDYSEVNFKLIKDKVKIICRIHGPFYQSVSKHLSGQQCTKCANIESGKNQRLSVEDFLIKAKKIHGELYNYSKVKYKKSIHKIEIVCKKHGAFLQTPNKHLMGRGCPKCKHDKIALKNRLSQEEFLERAIKKHGYIYDYSNVKYESGHKKISIICKKHGEFIQTASKHLQGQGCTKCSGGLASRAEIEWLDHLNINKRQKVIKLKGKKFIVDGFDPKTNTVYEFYGDYWHGNPEIHNPKDINEVNSKTYKHLYEKTMKRENLLKKAGFKLVTIWESEWNEIKESQQPE